MLTKILIPVAAFAVTVTSASAFTGNMWQNMDTDLSDKQISALEDASAMHQQNHAEIKAMLSNAGIDQEMMRKLRTERQEYSRIQQEAVREAIEDEDYESYLTAVANTPRINIVESEADFNKLIEAHELRENGEYDAAKEIMDGLGFERPERSAERTGMQKGQGGGNRANDGFGGNKN